MQSGLHLPATVVKFASTDTHCNILNITGAAGALQARSAAFRMNRAIVLGAITERYNWLPFATQGGGSG